MTYLELFFSVILVIGYPIKIFAEYIYKTLICPSFNCYITRMTQNQMHML